MPTKCLFPLWTQFQYFRGGFVFHQVSSDFCFSPSSHYDLTVVIAVAAYGFPLQTHIVFDHLSRQSLYSEGNNALNLSCLSLFYELKGLSTSHYTLKQHEALNRSLPSTSVITVGFPSSKTLNQTESS